MSLLEITDCWAEIIAGAVTVATAGGGLALWLASKNLNG